MKKTWITSLLLLNFLMAACNQEPVEEQKEAVSDTFDPDREIKEASKGQLTQAAFYKAKEGMSVGKVTETLGVELTLHTEMKDPASDKVAQVYIGDSKNPDIGAAMFIFEDGRLESKEEALKLNPDDHFILPAEFDLLRSGMTMADVEAIIGSTYGSSVVGYEANEEGKEVMVETAEYVTKKDGEKVVLVFRDHKLVSKEWVSAKSAVSH